MNDTLAIFPERSQQMTSNQDLSRLIDKIVRKMYRILVLFDPKIAQQEETSNVLHDIIEPASSISD